MRLAGSIRHEWLLLESETHQQDRMFSSRVELLNMGTRLGGFNRGGRFANEHSRMRQGRCWQGMLVTVYLQVARSGQRTRKWQRRGRGGCLGEVGEAS